MAGRPVPRRRSRCAWLASGRARRSLEGPGLLPQTKEPAYRKSRGALCCGIVAETHDLAGLIVAQQVEFVPLQPTVKVIKASYDPRISEHSLDLGIKRVG